jgi:hypothetical protein
MKPGSLPLEKNYGKRILRTAILPIITLLVLFPGGAKGQQEKINAEADSLFKGIWKGSSLCQIKNSPCHDEQVVYYISRTASDNLIEMRATKIVNGQEQEMGNIEFRFDAKSKQIISVSQPGAIWKFSRRQNTLNGTLIYNDALYRIIEVTRQ